MARADRALTEVQALRRVTHHVMDSADSPQPPLRDVVRVGVTGGRDFTDHSSVWRALDAVAERNPQFILIVGDARGADRFARNWNDMERHGQFIEVFAADWARYGPGAGPKRNQRMVDSGLDLLITFPGRKGTADMTRRAKAAGIKIEQN